MIYLAKELKAYFNSGLTLCGQDEDGDLEWVGTYKHWNRYESLLIAYDEEHE